MFNVLRTYFFWSVYCVGTLLLSLWLAWQVSAQVNFLYPAWYKLLQIEKTIDETMPGHLYKKEFIATNSEEHHRLFSEIVTSIQNSGRGLEQIQFYTPAGQKLGSLLTDNEIQHLQDVANLIDLLGWFVLVLLIFCLMILAVIIFFRIPMPSLKSLGMLMIAGIGAAVITLLILGAKKFFYWMHTVVFPNDHQWFFYYEESLMSTLMKAPDLFAPISIMLLLMGLWIWLLHLFLLRKFAGFKSV